MRRRFVLAAVLIIYFAILIRVIAFKDVEIHYGRMIFKLGPDYVVGHANFVPFASIWPYLRGDRGRFWALLNVGGNIVPFLPVGLLAALLFHRMSLLAAMAVGIAIGLTMEVTEVIFHCGRFDVDDITLNALGVIVGYAALRIIRRSKRLKPAPTSAESFATL